MMNDFKREARYYVIKIKDLSESQYAELRALFSGLQIPCTDCVVVESDWPNYEHTWKTIEKVSKGRFVDPYLEIERWKRVSQDQAKTISELQELIHLQRQQSAGVPKGYILMPESLTTENGAKYALIGEFEEVLDIECGACDGDDEECPLCDGQGAYTYRVPISWTTIKNIYKLATDKLRRSQPPAGQEGEQ